ncbi:alpha/beta fold hydrolase [Caldimonas brevitalea]|uniref:Alpha/beta hydrolase n=1 Tax=Caldimonas brevitalea TaxID=413882 RepID=A0A0G3BJ86_9BURK|nr:alpha/beta hydrolase [Caldimonas brevitalea]AKJ27431.1 alpha/beta hydrolase [Caldimonas brevitalea]
MSFRFSRGAGSGLASHLPKAAAVAAGLAACALLVRYKVWRAERTYTPRGRFIEVQGSHLHYLEYGSGAPLVLLHGNGSMAEEFDISGLVSLLARRWRVLVFDRPGYGSSEPAVEGRWRPETQAALLHAALQRLGVARPVVLGHSWGTLVALHLALQHPEHVGALVLASGYYYPTLRADVPLLAAPALPVLGQLMRHTVSPLISRLAWPGVLKRVFGPAPVTTAFRKRFPVWMTLRPAQLLASSTESALLIPSAFRLRRRYANITTPTVIIAGSDDRLVDTAWQSERLHRDLPHSELRLLPGVGHMVHHTAPVAVAEAVERAFALSEVQTPRLSPQPPNTTRVSPIGA